MCIIIAKNKGLKMPDNKTLERCFTNNPDGAGIMYAKNNAVHIRKGFMTYADFNNYLNELGNHVSLKDTALVMHFRITTHGSTNSSNCHPYPISKKIKDLKKTSLITDIGVAHNGIIPIKCIPKLSDTQTYIAKKLSVIHKIQPDFYTNKYIMQRIENEIQSKMCFLTKDEKIYTIGEFIEDNGVLYSNHSYNRSAFSLYDYHEFGNKEISVCPIYGIIIDSGDIYESEGFEYFIDKNDKVYEYDYLNNLLVPLENAQAFSFQGLPCHYNSEDSFDMPLWEGGKTQWEY